MSTMVDSKLAKSVSKSVGRAKEKILQNLGKVDRTADEIFDEHVGNFNKQQYAATRLQKELNNYIRCIRACAGASRALLEAVNEVYEPEWGGKELLTVNSQSVEMLWNDFAHRLAEQVLIPLNTYQGQFPETRKKIDKRGRKMVDFDGERHALQALQSNPRRAEAKLTKQRESLEAAKRTYEVLNSELHEELPGLFSSRIIFLVSTMSTLFASEHIFHSETSKVFTELEGIVDRLNKESAKGNLNFKMPSNVILNSSDSPKEDLTKGNSTASKVVKSGDAGKNHHHHHEQHEVSKPSTPTSTTPTPIMTLAAAGNGIGEPGSNNKMANGDTVEGKMPSSSKSSTLESHKGIGPDGDAPPGILHHENGHGHAESADHPHVHYDEKSNNVNADESGGGEGQKNEKGVLYRVRATYRYQKEDVDELSFEAGEIISVIEYDDPEEQEEGWLMGIKDNGERGMFPANFTRPL